MKVKTQKTSTISIKKRGKLWLLLSLIALSTGINVYFRLNSLFLPSIDIAAKEAVYVEFKNKLYNDILLSQPNLSERDKEKTLNTLFRKAIKEKRAEINTEISQKSKELKAYFQDEQGWTYLQEADPYRWFRRVDNFLTLGYFGNLRVNNQDYDTLMSAPLGNKVEPLKLHFYIGVYFYKFLHFLNSRLSPMNCLGFLPVFFCAIMVIAIFCLSILLGISCLSSFVVSLVIGLSPYILTKTSFGWFDTDIYNLSLPLIITSSLACFFTEKHSKYRFFFLFLCGLLIGIYSGLWPIWWHILYILIISLLLYYSNFIIYNKRDTLLIKLKEASLTILLFISFAYLWVFIISGWDAVKKSFLEPFSYLFLRRGLALDNFWPNLAFTVGELKRAEIREIVFGMGGSFFLYGGICGLLILIVIKRNLLDFKEKGFLFFVLIIWLLVMLGLTNFGIKFIEFLVIPVGISFGIFLDTLNNSIKHLKQNHITFFTRINTKLYNLISASIFTVAVLIPLYNASKISVIPLMNDSWWNMLTKIKQVTPRDAVINAYWNQGDWIMSIAKRATINDPSWQYTAVPYWFSKALLSANEEEAFGILRMLNSGANQAFEELSRALGNNKLLSLELINKIILLEKEEAEILLGNYTRDKEVIAKILKSIYGPPPPSYLLVYDQMVNIMPMFSTIANWDFERVDLWQRHSTLNKEDFINYCKERFKYSENYAQTIYDELKLMDKSNLLQWVSKENYRFYTPNLESFKDSEKSIFFDNGIVIDMENLRAYFRDKQGSKGLVPMDLIFIDGDAVTGAPRACTQSSKTFTPLVGRRPEPPFTHGHRPWSSGNGIENTNTKGNPFYSVLLTKNKGIYKAIMFSRPLAQSLFFKLYFMKGRGLKHFMEVHYERKDNGTNIYLYKIE